MSGFSIPIYRILNTNEDKIATPMFPEELPASFDSMIDIECEELTQWKLATGYLGTVMMLIKQYNDVISALEEKTACEVGIIQYIGLFSSQLSKAIESFSNSIILPIAALERASSEVPDEILGCIQSFLDDMGIVTERLKKLERVDDLLSAANNAVRGMLLLQPAVITGGRLLHSDN